MKPTDIINQLALTTKRGEKEQIIEAAFNDDSPDFFTAAKMACDPLISFGVKKVAQIDETDLNPSDPGTLSFPDFMALAEKLRQRRLTGHAARDAINEAAAQCHGPTWNLFYRRVLLKDFKVGVGAPTINKVLERLGKSDPRAKTYLVPKFECQLAVDGGNPVHAKKIKGRKFLDIKLDGARLLTFLDKDTETVTQYTREGAVNENFTAIRQGLEKLLEYLPGSVVLDGEIVGNSFQELMTQLNRNTKVSTDDAKLALFDIIPMDDFRAKLCRQPQHARHAVLCGLQESGLLAQCAGTRVYVVPKREIDLDTPEGQVAFAEFNREALAAKYEGIMIKDPEGVYRWGRWDGWIKRKPVISVSLDVVEVQRGKPDGQFRDVMGALLCRGEDDGRLIEVSVGSGFSVEQRADLWNRREEIVGMIAEVEADTLTLERGSSIYSLRFPRFKGFRGFEKGEKL